MRDRFDDLVAGHAVLERLPKVELELVAPIESDQTGDGDEAAVARAQPGRRQTSSNRTVLLISVRRGAMSPQGARIGVFTSAMASFLFVETTI